MSAVRRPPSAAKADQRIERIHPERIHRERIKRMRWGKILTLRLRK